MNFNHRHPFVSILFVNLLPLAGILFFDWNTFSIIFLYWLESVVIGLFNILKMITAQQGFEGKPMTKAGLVLFFMIHYFGFMLALGFYVFDDLIPGHGTTILPLRFPWIFMGMVISYFWTFINEFILNGKYQKASADILLAAPYPRIFIMVFIILTGEKFGKMIGTEARYAYMLILTITKFLSDILIYFIASKIEKAKLIRDGKVISS